MSLALIEVKGKDFFRELLEDKRSENTRRAYKRDLNDFFQTVFYTDPTPETVNQFLNLGRGDMTRVVLKYKASLIDKGLAEATINRRLAAIKSLVNHAYRVGHIDFKLDIPGEKVKPYRDTRGTDIAGMKKLLKQPDRRTLKGKRDYAILRLMWENALRRAEIVSLNIKDYWPWDNRLYITGKGQGTQQEPITVSPKTQEALNDYLNARGEVGGALFKGFDRAKKGDGRLTGNGLYEIIKRYSKQAGFEKPLSPHKIRHTSITAALDATNGNYRAVQRLSRHSKIDVLMVYDDNRQDLQGDVTGILAAQI